MPMGREAEAREFYAGVLGLPEKAKPESLAASGGAWFERGNLRVHLGVEQDFRPAQKAHIAFCVTGLDDWIGKLRAAGGSVVEDDRLLGFRRVFTHDPFGNRLEFLEPDSK